MKYQQLLMDFGRSVMRRVRAKPDDLAKPRRNSRLRHDPLLEDFANQLLKAAGCRHLKVRGLQSFESPCLLESRAPDHGRHGYVV